MEKEVDEPVERTETEERASETRWSIIRRSLEAFINHKSQSSLASRTLGVGGELNDHSSEIKQHGVNTHISPSKIAYEVCHFWLSQWIIVQLIMQFIHTSPPQKLHTRMPFLIESVNKNTVNHVDYSPFSPSKIAYEVCHFWMGKHELCCW